IYAPLSVVTTESKAQFGFIPAFSKNFGDAFLGAVQGVPHRRCDAALSLRGVEKCPAAQLARGQTEARLECATEVRGIKEPPPGGDGCDRKRRERGVGQIAPAVLEPPLTHPRRHRRALLAEQ